MAGPESHNNHPGRIIVRTPNWLGDAVMSIPALVRLREARPQTHIAVLTPEKLAELWLHHPAVNRVITFKPGESVFAVSRRLRAEQFDIAVVLPNSPRSALEPWLAGIPKRLGYARPWRRWFLSAAAPGHPGAVRLKKRSVREIRKLIARGAANNSTANCTPSAHQIRHYLFIAACLGAAPEPVAPTLAVTEEEKLGFNKLYLARPGTVLTLAANLGAIAPGAEYGPAKRWPAERFVAAANEISNRTGCQWLIFGSAADRPVAQQVAAGIPGAFNLAGRTPLRQLMAGLALCRVLLANDSGAAHLGAAVGTPVVVPFGSTSPELTGPGLPGDKRHRLLKSDAPCAPCFRRTCPIDHRCMKNITVARVIEAAIEVGFPGTSC